MTRRVVLLSVAIALLIAGTGALLFKRSAPAGSSTLSASAEGWLAARTYWERRGTAVSLLDRPLDAAAPFPQKSLVLTFPWQTPPSSEELREIQRRLVAGTVVVLAYAGSVPGYDMQPVASELGLDVKRIREHPPLSPRRWWAYASADWRLEPEDAFAPPGTALEVVIHPPDWMPRAPAAAEVLYRGEDRMPVIFSFPRGLGRVIVLPADALSNARLDNSGNADLLESLRVALGSSVAVDEFHHGLVSPTFSADAGSRPSLDLLLLELGLLYLLCVWRLGRRFGPAWQEPPEIASSTSAFLLGLAGLHRKLHHAAPAAVRLIDGAESYDPRIAVPGEVRNAAFDSGETGLLEIATAVARLQRRGRFD